uniref:Uncharacterized protein n=1 Tax=Amphimedon queenslandica TaxID=400682 RepID=A0A1X7SR77_AMPQE
MMPDFSKHKFAIIVFIIACVVVVIGIFLFINYWKRTPVERTVEKQDVGGDVQEPANQSQDNERNEAEDKSTENDIEVDDLGPRHKNLNNNGVPHNKGSEQEDNEKEQNKKPTHPVPQQDQIVDEKHPQMPPKQDETNSPAENAALFPKIETCDAITNPSSKSSHVDVEVPQSPIQKEIESKALDLDDGSPTKITTGSEIADQPDGEVILEDDIVKKDQATPLEKAKHWH